MHSVDFKKKGEKVERIDNNKSQRIASNTGEAKLKTRRQCAVVGWDL